MASAVRTVNGPRTATQPTSYFRIEINDNQRRDLVRTADPTLVPARLFDVVHRSQFVTNPDIVEQFA